MAPPPLAPVKLLSVVTDRTLDHFFNPNPKSIRRNQAAEYAEIPLAYSDCTADVVTAQWTRTRPARIELEFLLVGITPISDVENEIEKFERMLQKTAQTGEPPSMYFVCWRQMEEVRVENVDWSPILFTRDLQRQQVESRVTLRVLKPAITIR